MSLHQTPQDEPFNHADLIRGHSRTGSSVNLLQSESSVSDTLYDPHDSSKITRDKQANYDSTDVQRTRSYQDLEYADDELYDSQTARPINEKARPLSRFLAIAPGEGRNTLQQRIDRKKRGIGRQRYPFVAWTLAVAMLGVLIYELVLNSKAQGTPISFHPVVNPMLGPSQSALINAGARFPPCMKDVQGLTPSTLFACLNDTDNPPTRLCPLEDVCGFGGFHDDKPNQWFRFITPVFLHAGIIHFVLNMLAQLTASAEVEKEMGSAGFLLLYMAAGIFGNVLGGNFALVAAPSIGASGAIFGTVAVAWIDLFAHWKYTYRPVRKLLVMILELVLGIAIGFIPYVDNFAHIGGFLMGLLVGMVFYPIISASRRHQIITWVLRIAVIPLAVVLFVVLIRNFYTSDPYAACSWCRYLSCIPTSSNNHCQGVHYYNWYKHLSKNPFTPGTYYILPSFTDFITAGNGL